MDCWWAFEGEGRKIKEIDTHTHNRIIYSRGKKANISLEQLGIWITMHSLTVELMSQKKQMGETWNCNFGTV